MTVKDKLSLLPIAKGLAQRITGDQKGIAETHEESSVTTKEIEQISASEIELYADRYLALSRVAWQILFLSFLLDPIFLAYIPDLIETRSETNSFDTLLIALMIATCVFSQFDILMQKVQALRDLNRRYPQGVKVLGIISSFGVVAVIFFALLGTANFNNIIPLIVFLITIIGGLPSFLKNLRKNREHHVKLRSNRRFWVEQYHRNLFVLQVVPLLSSRAIAAVAAASVVFTDKSLLYYGFFATLALMFLLVSVPERRNFFVPCRNCGAWTSRIFSDYRGCPICEKQAYRAGARKSGSEISPTGGESPFKFSFDDDDDAK